MKKMLCGVIILFPLFVYAQEGGQIVMVVTQLNIQGTVKTPADSVQIKIYIGGTTDTLFGITDSIGRCEIKNVPAGVNTIVGSKKGFLTFTCTGVIVADLKTTYLINSNQIILSPVRKGIRLVPADSPKKKSKRKKRKTQTN